MYEILFVDDDIETAKEYAEQVHHFTKLRPIVCSKGRDAINAVREFPIAVAILDQKMPDVSGTDLFRELKKISPRIRAIMLSGEADEAEIGEAMNLGYNKRLHKQEISKLPGFVFEEYTRFQTSLARSLDFEPILLCTVKKYWGFAGSVEFWLEAVAIEEEDEVDNRDWRLVDRIDCGEKRTIREIYEISAELEFKESLERTLSSNFEIANKAAVEVRARLDGIIAEKIDDKFILKESKKREITRELSLAPEPANPDEKHVKARAFYWAPIYRRIQCHIAKKIYPASESVAVLLTIRKPTGYVATKQVDHFSDGTEKTLQTGAFRFETF